MTSSVRIDVPTSKIAYTADLRDNFARIKAELEQLQNIIFGGIPQNSPEFTGLMSGESAQLSGNLFVAGTAALNVLGMHDGTVGITYGTLWAPDAGGSVVKTADKMVHINLNMVASGVGVSPLVTLPAGFRPISDRKFLPVVYFDASVPGQIAAYANISSSTGAITIAGVAGALPAVAAGDIASFNFSFLTAGYSFS